jgi:hypothetical protein
VVKVPATASVYAAMTASTIALGVMGARLAARGASPARRAGEDSVSPGDRERIGSNGQNAVRFRCLVWPVANPELRGRHRRQRM